VQLTGGSTYIISLPKEWVKQLGIKPGDEVEIAVQGDMKLLLYPKKEERQPLQEVSIGCEGLSPEMVVREFIAHYMAGYSLVRFFCPKIRGEDREFVKDQVRRRLLGAEVVEEDAETVQVQFLVGSHELSLGKAIVRASTLSQLMYRDSLKALMEGDSELARDIMERDDEVDRFYFYVVRQLSLSTSSPDILEEDNYTPSQVIQLYVIAKSIERVSDHAVRVAEQVPDARESKPEPRKEVVEMGERSLETYKQAISSFRNHKRELAHTVVSSSSLSMERDFRKVSEGVISSNQSTKSTVALLLVLNSVRRVHRYSIDIAESVIDMMAKT